MPALTLIVSAGLGVIASQAFFKDVSKKILLVVLILGFMLWGVRGQFSLAPNELGLWIYGNLNPFNEAILVADKVKSITSDFDTVFIAGSEPEILYYAKRKSPTRFVITYPLIINSPLRLSYQKEVVTDLTKQMPKAIVVSQRQYSGAWNESAPRVFIDFLTTYLANNYQLVGGYVWSGNIGYWQDKLTADELNLASLLVYQKL